MQDDFLHYDFMNHVNNKIQISNNEKMKFEKKERALKREKLERRINIILLLCAFLIAFILDTPAF